MRAGSCAATVAEIKTVAAKIERVRAHRKRAHLEVSPDGSHGLLLATTFVGAGAVSDFKNVSMRRRSAALSLK